MTDPERRRRERWSPPLTLSYLVVSEEQLSNELQADLLKAMGDGPLTYNEATYARLAVVIQEVIDRHTKLFVLTDKDADK